MARYIDYSKIPMGKNDIGAKTIGEYFEKLLLTLWDEQEDFSGKRPFGNGGWEYDVYAALISAGVVDGSLDEEGYVVDVTYSAANNIICEMIKQIFNAPTADVVPRAELDAMRGAANSYKMHYEKAKQEADRLAVELEAEKALGEVRIERIFEEIEASAMIQIRGLSEPQVVIERSVYENIIKKYLPGGEDDEGEG